MKERIVSSRDLKEEGRETETWLFIISSRTQNKIKNKGLEEPRTEGRPSAGLMEEPTFAPVLS